ncbi:c-type cytochrome [Chondromyces crocatus]|uniref:Cytochrome C peroxidase n=1 Tax=Chondromyces crocatus TaxID=52 RepID=A0A0K1EBC7_CHOCO|nr:c-type cytochrome [Chondromyces crocatus]AKT38186.1 cytochrome C peroxidase [Chondromyces crocatus]
MIQRPPRSALPPLARACYPHLVSSPFLWGALCTAMLVAVSACGTDPAPSQPTTTVEPLFNEAFQSTNGRSCATCHVPEDNFALTSEHVVRRFETNPNDPLFAAIDADDPTAETLTFDHLKKGLVRVWITLPDNMDQLDEVGNVITAADRRIFVWRSVPSIADAALTAPYQLDGRVETLEEQAQEAITGHSEGGAVSQTDLARIAAFERSIFTSDRARKIADELASGVAFDDLGDVEASLSLSPQEQRGKELYEKTCEACHGGASKTKIKDREIHALAFPALKADGNVLYQVPATDPPTPVLAHEPENEFINIGSAMENFLVQIGATEHQSFTRDVSFPSYRFRFYKDASRTEIVTDLPPALPPDNPFEFAVDDDGNPISGPNFFPQLFTTDPGRAAITGNPYDFEAFDIPTLRGIAKTAPYWHNNISETLEEVVDLYSDHLFSKFPSFTQPGEKEQDPDGDIGPPEAFTANQKKDLVAYLKRL